MPRLSKKRFFQWARAHENEKCVTRLNEDACYCPVARYARSEGFRHVLVGPHGLTDQWMHDGKGCWLPEWAVQVVTCVDSGDQSRPIGVMLAELRDKYGVRP